MEDTALIVAASKGHLHIIEYLVEHGAKINHVDKVGYIYMLVMTSIVLVTECCNNIDGKNSIA